MVRSVLEVPVGGEQGGEEAKGRLGALLQELAGHLAEGRRLPGTAQPA